ncbi:MAG: hypothetical protein ACRC2I_09290, partial [Plesiomonas shigelloides]
SALLVLFRLRWAFSAVTLVFTVIAMLVISVKLAAQHTARSNLLIVLRHYLSALPTTTLAH